MTETPTTQVHPATGFSVDDWLQDAALPEESAMVYKRADVLSELSELKRRIELEERVADAEQSAGQASTTAALLAEYEALLHTFSASGLTVYVRAITDDERAGLRVAHETRTRGWEPKVANEAFGYDLLSLAITHVKPAGGERTPVSFTVAQIEALEKSIGNPQMQQILKARQVAQNALPAVDADFLRRPSGEGTGQA